VYSVGVLLWELVTGQVGTWQGGSCQGDAELRSACGPLGCQLWAGSVESALCHDGHCCCMCCQGAASSYAVACGCLTTAGGDSWPGRTGCAAGTAGQGQGVAQPGGLSCAD